MQTNLRESIKKMHCIFRNSKSLLSSEFKQDNQWKEGETFNDFRAKRQKKLIDHLELTASLLKDLRQEVSFHSSIMGKMHANISKSALDA